MKMLVAKVTEEVKKEISFDMTICYVLQPRTAKKVILLGNAYSSNAFHQRDTSLEQYALFGNQRRCFYRPLISLLIEIRAKKHYDNT